VARTPLFALLQRASRLTRQADASGIPLDELIDGARPSGGVSRREFLAAAGASAAALAAGGCASLPLRRSTREPQVIVVGAGLAGLTAAYRLHAAGVPVRVIEAQERLGGRCYSLRGFFDQGQVAELGGELIDTGHRHVHGLCEEFELPLDDLSQEVPGTTGATYFFGGRRYGEREVLEAFAPVARQLRRDLEHIGGDGPVTYRTPFAARALDELTVDEWLTASGCTGWLRHLLDVAYTAEHGLECGEQSALNLLMLIGTDEDAFALFGESDERYHVRGGNDRIVSALASHVGHTVVTGTILEAVRERPDGQIELSVRRGSEALTMAAPHVVLALPFTLLRTVQIDLGLPPAKRAAIGQLGYGTNAKLMMGFDTRVWRTRHQSNGSLVCDLGLQSTWETSRAQPGAAGILTNFSGGRQGLALGEATSAEQALRAIGQLEQVFPTIANGRKAGKDARFHWPSHQWTKGSYSTYRPGQWTTLRGAEGERVGNVHFAGEHCSLVAQGFLEGAVETGESAAREVLADLGISTVGAQSGARRALRRRDPIPA
jgi:monoamine oxidase